MTLLWMTLRVALTSVWAHKLRSTLTMLGIIIGISSVILLVALGKGAKEAALGEIRSVAGVDTLYIGAVYRGTSANYHRLKIEDCEAILNEVPEISGVSPLVDGSPQLKVGNRKLRASLTGVALPYFQIGNYQIEAGRLFTPQEELRPRKVAVLGHKIVEDLFRGDAEWAIGREIKIEGDSYDVIGTLKEKGGLSGSDTDNRVFIPYTTAMKRVTGRQDFWTMALQLEKDADRERAIARLGQTLRRQHRLEPREEDDFRIMDPSEAMRSFSAVIQVFTIFIASIAGVSLMVGGIGIMNIMLVSVTERTREIGLRKALGARRGDIMRQFLLEALIVSLVGGTMGVSIGVALTEGFNLAIAKIPGAPPTFDATVSAASVLLAFGFCFLIGIFFGLYPARKAARLDPIEALRYE